MFPEPGSRMRIGIVTKNGVGRRGRARRTIADPARPHDLTLSRRLRGPNGKRKPHSKTYVLCFLRLCANSGPAAALTLVAILEFRPPWHTLLLWSNFQKLFVT